MLKSYRLPIAISKDQPFLSSEIDESVARDKQEASVSHVEVTNVDD